MNVTTKDLKTALAALAPALKRSLHENVVHLKADGDTLTLRAGHDPLIETRVSATTLGFDSWEAVVLAATLPQLTKVAGEELELTFEPETDASNPLLAAKSGKTSFEVQALSDAQAERLPLDLTPFPKLDAPVFPNFHDALKRALTCASNEHYQEHFRCVAFEKKGDGKLHVTGTDGFRLGTTAVEYELPFNAYIPNGIANALTRLGDDVRVVVEGEYFFAWDGIISTRIMLKEITSWVDWERIIPAMVANLSVSKQHLVGALKRAAVLVDKGENNRIDMNVEGNHLRIVSKGAYGRGEERLALTETPPLEFPPMAFNVAFLQDALWETQDEITTIGASGPASPCVIAEGGARLLLVPLRVA